MWYQQLPVKWEPFGISHTSYSYVEDGAVSGRKWEV
jgi:hypothetical protein